MGRNSTYSAEVQKESEAYVRGGYRELGDLVPMKSSLAIELGRSRQTLETWAQTHEEFALLMDELMARQERTLVNGGLGKEFDSPLTRTMLTNHGYRVGTDVAHTSPDGSMSPNRIEIVAGDDGKG